MLGLSCSCILVISVAFLVQHQACNLEYYKLIATMASSIPYLSFFSKSLELACQGRTSYSH